MKFFDRIPLAPLLVFAVFLSIAPFPFQPQPHLLQKIIMLVNGTLSKPVDMFDLFWHSFGLILLALKLYRMRKIKHKR